MNNPLRNKRPPRVSHRTTGLAAGCLLPCLLLVSGAASGQERMTNFRPEKDGFNFSNTFNNDAIKEIDLRTGGLCGGMVYSALDYYYNRRTAVPRQDFKPANRSPLQSYIYGRQMDSLGPNLTKWAEIGLNPDGARDREFFSWGLGSEFANLRARIDAGHPAPLGLQGHGRGGHQVLAIGYEQGRGGASSLKIHIYDPNFPNRTQVLMADERRALFYYRDQKDLAGKHTHLWRTYFVDKSYRAKSPADISTPRHPDDGVVREVVVEFQTGNDDLRGGNDNVGMDILLRSGDRVQVRDINLRARWLSNYTEHALVCLPRPVRESDIAAFEFVTTFRGGISGDNWDAKRIIVWQNFGTRRKMLTQRSAFFRFTGDRRSVRVPMPGASRGAPPTKAEASGKITHLRLTFKTGGDDLRGGNDNLDVTILYRDGRSQRVNTVNSRQNWSNGSTRTVSLALDRPVDRGGVSGLVLNTTARGGFNGDNWNLDALTVIPVRSGDDPQPAYLHRSGRPLKRFTGDSRSLSLRW